MIPTLNPYSQLETYNLNHVKPMEVMWFNSLGANAVQGKLVTDYFQKCSDIYSDDFNAIWNKHQSVFIDINKNIVHEVYQSVQKDIIDELDYDSFTITLTPDISLHTTIRIYGFKLFIEAFFDEDGNAENEIILNVFKEKDCLIAYGGSLKDIKSKIDEFFINQFPTKSIFIFQQNELSGSFITKSKFQDYQMA